MAVCGRLCKLIKTNRECYGINVYVLLRNIACLMFGTIYKVSLQDGREVERYSIADVTDTRDIAIYALATLPCGDVVTVTDGGATRDRGGWGDRIRWFGRALLLRRAWVLFCMLHRK